MNIPPLELLEANHTFPGPYVFKIIGENKDKFVERVVHETQVELGSLDVPKHSTRLAEGGRHVAVTIEILVEDAPQVLALYARYKALDGVILLL
jgi:putative lipoic acid-binding regulatory protein